MIRRHYDDEMGVNSLVRFASCTARLDVERGVRLTIEAFPGDLQDHAFVFQTIQRFEPEAIVHFAEQRSAPYSMIDRDHAVYTQVNTSSER